MSRGYVHEQYAWRHYYWVLKDEGVAFLKQKLSLPDDVMPKTHTRKARAMEADMGGRQAAYGGGRMHDDHRGAYRGGDDAGGGQDKTADAGLGSGQVGYGRVGYGRGRPAGPQ